MNVRFARAPEEAAVNAFAKRFKAIRDFVYTWKRWGNWETAPPLIVVDPAGQVLGFHAATYSSRTGYINSYYIAVDESLRGQGFGGALIDATLSHGINNGCSRLKMKCHFDSPGVQFWEGFGVRRFAQDDVQYLYDVDITNVESISNFIEWMKHPEYHQPPSQKAVAAYQRAGARLL